MSRSDVEQELRSIRRFLEELARNQKLVKSTDPELRELATQAGDHGRDVDQVIQEVHRHWEK
jgi:hypothetical protein